VLLRPSADVLPEENPWQFFSEGGGELGAQGFRFVTQNGPLSNTAEHASSWVEVAYFLEEDSDGGLVLWRWISPRPPSSIDRGLPDSGDEGAMRIVTGVADFGVRFQTSLGDWADEWDSSFMPPKEALPEGAEIALALYRPARQGETEDDTFEVAGQAYKRRVMMPMRPIDLAALIQAGLDEDSGPDCFTLSQCLDLGDSQWYQEELEADCDGDDELCELLNDPSSTCWNELETSFPEVAALAPPGCES